MAKEARHNGGVVVRRPPGTVSNFVRRIPVVGLIAAGPTAALTVGEHLTVGAHQFTTDLPQTVAATAVVAGASIYSAVRANHAIKRHQRVSLSE